MRVGIVGAGMAGLSCAEGLAVRGHEVVLFDKGRGPGGRMSTRRMETTGGIAHFDHGAQYFTVRDSDFESQVNVWIAEGIVALWPAAGAGAHVGVPAMNTPIRQLAGRHTVNWAAQVTTVERRGAGWRVTLADGQTHDLDLIVIAIPAEQAAALLAEVAPDLAARARTARSEPCWTAMVAFSHPVEVSRDCWAGRDDQTIGWAARNSAKPGRTGPESWVVQASPGWSRQHIGTEPGRAAEDLIAALSDELGVQLPPRLGVGAHLWRFARCADGAKDVIFEQDQRLGLCGDWLIGPRIESAWISGARLAQRIGAWLQA